MTTQKLPAGLIDDVISDLSLGTFGHNKTGKSSLLLSSPKPLIIYDLDRSIGRAIIRWHKQNPTMRVKLVLESEALDYNLLNGDWDVIIRQVVVPTYLPGQPVTGYINLWNDFFLQECIGGVDYPIASLGIDTGTILWAIAHRAHLEKAQQNNSNRERLTQIEYGIPNMELRGIFNKARNSNKNFILVHHPKTAYGEGPIEDGRGNVKIVKNTPIGDTWDGFLHMGRAVDITVEHMLWRWCKWEPCAQSGIAVHPLWDSGHTAHDPMLQEIIPVLRIVESGYSLKMNGMIVPNPTVQALIDLVNKYKGE